MAAPMTPEPPSDTRLAEIRERARRMIADKVTYAPVQYTEDYSVLLAEVERLRGELHAVQQATCPVDCPCRQIPLQARWDKTVMHPRPDDTEDTETVVCCVAEGGQPVALFLDEEQREALGLALLLPDGDGEVDPAHLELSRENERLRAELAGLDDLRLRAIDKNDQLHAQVVAVTRLLPDDPAEDINASWIPPRHIRAALAAASADAGAGQ